MLDLGLGWFLPMFWIAVALLTTVPTLAIGRRRAEHNRGIAVVLCTVAVPLLIIAGAVTMLVLSPQGPPPNDGPAMASFGLFMMALVALPASFITSLGLMLYAMRRSGSG